MPAALSAYGCVWFIRASPTCLQRYDATWKPFPQTSLFCPVCWQLLINILSLTDPTAGTISWHAGNTLSSFQIISSGETAWCQPPMILLPVFPICWTFILHLFHSHFSSIMELLYLTMLLVQFLPLCNFTWMFPILSRICFYRSFALCCFPFVSLVYSGQGKSKTDRFCYSLLLILQNGLFRE